MEDIPQWTLRQMKKKMKNFWVRHSFFWVAVQCSSLSIFEGKWCFSHSMIVKWPPVPKETRWPLSGCKILSFSSRTRNFWKLCRFLLGKKNFVQKTSLAFHNGISKLQISRSNVIMHKINGDFLDILEPLSKSRTNTEFISKKKCLTVFYKIMDKKTVK